MSVGKIIIAIEARVEDLESQLAQIESSLKASTDRMEKEVSKVDTAFTKWRKGMLKAGIAVAILTTAIKALEVAGKGLVALWSKLTESNAKANSKLNEFVQALHSIPIAGIVTKTIEGVIDYFGGFTEHIDKTNKEINRLLAQQAETDRKVQARRSFMEGQDSKNRIAQENLDIFNEEDERRKIIMQADQEYLKLLDEVDRKKEKAKELGLNRAAIAQMLEELALRRDLIVAIKNQKLAEFDANKEREKNNDIQRNIANALEAKIEQRRDQLDKMREDLSRAQVFSGLRTTASVGTAVGGFTTALGAGRQAVVEQAAKSQVRLQQGILTVIENIKQLIENRNTVVGGII